MFDFLGTLTESQKRALVSWVRSQYSNDDSIQDFHKVRAAKLRRTSGLLNAYYKQFGIESTFTKDIYKEPIGGQPLLEDKDDRWPAKIVSDLKENFLPELKRYDEAQFQLNNVCVQIERAEDDAHFRSLSHDESENLIQRLENLFSDDRYNEVLIRDADIAKYRTNSLQPKTAYEEALYPTLKESE